MSHTNKFLPAVLMLIIYGVYLYQSSSNINTTANLVKEVENFSILSGLVQQTFKSQQGDYSGLNVAIVYHATSIPNI